MWKKNIQRFAVSLKDFRKQNDQVALELKIKLSLNKNVLATLSSTPMQLNELAAGYLFTHQLINSAHDICQTKISLSEINISTQKPTATFSPTLPPKTFTMTNLEVIQLISLFQEKAQIYSQTGITHRAALAQKNTFAHFAEDIYRLSSIDKVLGSALLQESQNQNYARPPLLITSGKITIDTVEKAACFGNLIIIARSGPTDQAIALAKKYHLTIIGFAQGKRFNIYTNHERIKLT
jgi:FdhD protein